MARHDAAIGKSQIGSIGFAQCTHEPTSAPRSADLRALVQKHQQEILGSKQSVLSPAELSIFAETNLLATQPARGLLGVARAAVGVILLQEAED